MMATNSAHAPTTVQLRRHHPHGGGKKPETVATLPPIPRANLLRDSDSGKDDLVVWQKRRLEPLGKDLTRARSKESKQRAMAVGSITMQEPNNSRTPRSMTSIQIIRSPTLYSNQTESVAAHKSRINENKNDVTKGIRNVTIGTNVTQETKRMSYPPTGSPTWSLKTESCVGGVTSLQRGLSQSCPMLCNLNDLDDSNSNFGSSKNIDKIPNTAPLSPITNLVKDIVAKTRVSGDRGRAKLKGKKMGHGRHDDSLTKRPPKPPSWQTISTEEEPADGESGTEEKSAPAPEQQTAASALSQAEGRCHSAGSSRSSAPRTKMAPDIPADDLQQQNSQQPQQSTSRRASRRPNIKRTRSRIIDAREIPKQGSVIPLSETKPSEFNLRKTHHDNDVYLTENAQRCRQWLASLREEDDASGADQGSKLPRAAAAVELSVDSDDDLVTCDLELPRDKWMYVGSPYPSSSSEEES